MIGLGNPTQLLAARFLLAALLPSAFLPAQTATEGSRKWAFSTLSTATAGNIVGAPALASDGTIYIGVQVGASTSAVQSGLIFAVNPNGTVKWSLPTADWIDSTPAVGPDGTLYIGGWDGKLQAIAPDKTVKWTFTAGGFIVSSAAVGADGTLYFGSGNGNLYAVTSAGVLKWFFPTGDWIDSSPAIGPDGTVYFGSWDKNVYAVRPDGTLRWKQATLGNVSTSPAIASDGTVYIASRDLSLYSFAADGSLRWKTAFADLIEASPVIGPDGTVYVVTTGSRVYALTPDGGERWRYPDASAAPLLPVYATPAVRADGSLVLATSNNALIVLGADGVEQWRSVMDDWTDSSPVIAPDGTIYLGCTDKKLYAISATRASATTEWPHFRRDAQRRGAATPVAPPAVVSQPVARVVAAGAGTTFAVTASGQTPVSYAWTRNGQPLADGGNVSGSATATLSLVSLSAAESGAYQCRVTNPGGTTLSAAAMLSVISFVPSHALVIPGYAPGSAVSVTNALVHSNAAGALVWSLLLPTGWNLASSSGDEGATRPAAGTTDILEWRWASPPPSPFAFGYVLNVPPASAGDKQLAALVTVGSGETSLQVTAKPDPLLVAQIAAHSADADRNLRLSLPELTRVIELYNTRNGATRTGAYSVQAGSEDGFSAAPARASSELASLSLYHSADANRDAKIGLVELTRVIELYNTRAGTTRTGQYHVQTGTEDGFAPGP